MVWVVSLVQFQNDVHAQAYPGSSNVSSLSRRVKLKEGKVSSCSLPVIVGVT